MDLATIDYVSFVGFIALVVGVSLYASRKHEGAEGYFLAGRNLVWWLVGFSLIASNISTEHFVGMAGQGFGSVGLAIASYEWIAAVTLVIVALVLLPRFLRSGIFTIPEYLEYRYGLAARTTMSVYVLLMYTFVALASILFSGAIGIRAIFGLNLTVAVWIIGILAAAYTIYGGLKAVVWSDLIQGIALLVGGAFVMVLGFEAVGGVGAFFEDNADKLHMVLPADHPDIPWTALFLGIWIPNIFYWGLNQFIIQRALGAQSLAAAQKGVVFAALIKLFIPFIIVFPGIMAFQLYAGEISSGDEAYPILITNLLPPAAKGVMLAALFGAVMSSLDSLLNSASTLFTMDIHKKFIRPKAEAKDLVRVGRVVTAVLVVFGCLIAPLLDNPSFGGIFNYIQMFQGFISPGIVVVFFFGLIVKRAPHAAAMAALLLNIPIYGALLWLLPDVAFLNHMAITFVALVVVMAIITFAKPLPEPVVLPVQGGLDLTPSPGSRIGGFVVIALTVALYIIFW